MKRRGLNLRKALLRFILPFLRAFPPRTAARALTGIGHFEYRHIGGVRIRFDRAVSRGGRHLGREWDVPEEARRLAGNHIRWRTRDLLLDGLGDDKLDGLFPTIGREHLDRAVAEGRGAILLGNHFGANLMPAHWLAREGYDFRLYMERPRHISKFLDSRFDTEGPDGQRDLFISRKSDPSKAAASIVKAARMLKAGRIVKMACDVRWSGAHTTTAEFLGCEHDFAHTWVKLAAMTGAPVIPVFCSMKDDGSYLLEFLEPFSVPAAEASTPEAIAGWVRLGLSQIESRLADSPGDSNDYFFWGGEDDPSHGLVDRREALA